MKKQNRVAFFNILSTLLLRGISLFTAPVFAALLGTNGYGILSTYNVWVSVCAIVGTLQTQGTLVNARVEYDEGDQEGYQSSVMSMSLLFFGACTVIVLLFLGPISSAMELEKLLILLILFQSFGTFCVNFLNTKYTYEMKAGRNMVVSVGVALVSLALSVILILLVPKEINYYGRILGNAITYGVLGIGISIAILARGRKFYDAKYWKFCIVLALPAVFYNLSDLLLGHSDLVMLKSICGNDASGIYGLAYNFGGIMFTIFVALNNSWVPFYFEDMKQGNRDNIHRQAKNFLELFTVLSCGFLLLTMEVYHIFAKKVFWSGTGLVPLFVASYYINFLCTFPVNFEYYHKKIRVVAAATIGSSLINIGLNYLFITRVGIYGAAVATMISHILQFTLHYLYCRYVLGEYPFGIRLWAGYAAAFIGVVGIFYLVPGMWYVRWALGGAIGIWELLRIRQRKVLI